jgi:hypothetical protein
MIILYKLLLATLLIVLNFGSSYGKEINEAYASFARTTIVCHLADLKPSIIFWRDVMGFEYSGAPEPATGSSSLLGWDDQAVRYFTSFKSKNGSTIALLMVENAVGFSTLELPEKGVSYGGVVLVHTAKNIKELYDRAVSNNLNIIKHYGLSSTGKSMQLFLRAPTGQVVEVYELLGVS